MAKTKTKTNSIKMPRGSKPSLIVKDNRPHFDSVDIEFNKKHYGKYLLVKKGSTDRHSTNRLYLCLDSKLEFMQSYAPEHFIKNYKLSDINLITLFPEQEIFIWKTLSQICKPSLLHKTSEGFVHGLGLLLAIFKKLGIELNDMHELRGIHIRMLVKL